MVSYFFCSVTMYALRVVPQKHSLSKYWMMLA